MILLSMVTMYCRALAELARQEKREFDKLLEERKRQEALEREKEEREREKQKQIAQDLIVSKR